MAMKLVYEPANAIEAHMILNLLEQAGLSGRVDGEFLQGGVGELQASGFIRVMIEEVDYEAARKIIEQWDKYQPRELIEEGPKRAHPVFSGFIGLCVGLISLTIYYNTPTTYDGIDFDGDGLLDEKWVYVHDKLSKIEVDRDFDGKADHIIQYDRKGHIESASSDDNFDGVFETDWIFLNGNIQWTKSDTTSDGYQDYQQFFSNGVLNKVKFIDPVSGKPLKTQTYDRIKLRSAELDSNGDGKFDTSYLYDELEEIKKVDLGNKNG